MFEVTKLLRQGVRIEPSIRIRSEREAISSDEGRRMFQVGDAILDRGGSGWIQESTVEIEADDGVARSEGSVLVVQQMACVVSGEGGGIRMGRTDGTVRRP